jgi:ribosomal protein S18 acetylase RimI-like enzyme
MQSFKPLAHDVRHAVFNDRKLVTEMLGMAFQDDPVMSYIFPDPIERRLRLPSFFAVIFKGDEAAGACYMTSAGEAATLWRAPGHSQLSLREKIWQSVPWLQAAGFALGRALTVSAASDANHPKEPHWYLHIAGCSPAWQGKGFGSAAIKKGLERADAEGFPCHLETANEANLIIYQALGFRVTHQWYIPNGPANWSMFRAAQNASL